MIKSRASCCVISSFITKPQLVDMNVNEEERCVISSFITKPQPAAGVEVKQQGCVISSFITKPQHTSRAIAECEGCVISSFITKPQLASTHSLLLLVALYLLSSPNHNSKRQVSIHSRLRYIFFHHQTTTDKWYCYYWSLLRYIFFHHQTTTGVKLGQACEVLRYIFFHHQTTTMPVPGCMECRCVISSFITKPQRQAE